MKDGLTINNRDGKFSWVDVVTKGENIGLEKGDGHRALVDLGFLNGPITIDEPPGSFSNKSSWEADVDAQNCRSNVEGDDHEEIHEAADEEGLVQQDGVVQQEETSEHLLPRRQHTQPSWMRDYVTGEGATMDGRDVVGLVGELELTVCQVSLVCKVAGDCFDAAYVAS
ncbi:hypothetical protein V6N11_016677 [Hibiscus sabdariffa]|uniref:Uncharacterized protein n=1 Tax=Hibiscus sabdariffa TaxID=183260 RepID=A0ABR2TVR6_9ROSI